jgi:tetratricopeptide (TPR) repeat protein
MRSVETAAGRFLLLALALTFVLSGCGNDKSEGQKAADPLKAGLSAQRAGRVAEAERDYRDVLAKDPNNKYAYYNLGLIAQQAGQSQDAEEDYRVVLRLDPDYEPALFNLAILRTSPDVNEAISLYRHAIAVSPGYAAAHLNLGFALKQTGKSSEGDAELAKAVSLDPSLASRMPQAQPAQPVPTPTTPKQ